MSSKKLTQTTLLKYGLEKPRDLKKPRNKFLTRNLRIGNQDDAAYQTFCVKRFYIKKVIDPREEDFYITDHNVISKIFKNRKVFKTIKTAHVPFSLQRDVHTNLKYSKNLKHYGFYTDSSDNPIDNVTFYIKKLSPKVQSIRLEIWKSDLPFENQDFYDIARSIRRFQKLKYFTKANDFDTNEVRTHVQRELGIYNQSASRLKNLKKMMYNISHGEQPSFQRMVRRGAVSSYPGITGLRLNLMARMLLQFEHMEPFFEEEDSFDDVPKFDEDDMTDDQRRAYRKVQDQIKEQDGEKGDDLQSIVKYLKDRENAVTVASESMQNNDENPAFNDERFRAKCIMREEMKPFYRFDLFPNLKELDIAQWGPLYPLDSFVVNGFKARRNLESLKIRIYGRSMGTSYLFKGLLELPLLKKFELYINFLQNRDWIDLKTFLKNQKELESLSLGVGEVAATKSRYLCQNSSLEEIIKDFENKPKLKSLEFGSSFWPLESLSKGFSNLTMENQLHTFKFSGCDDTLSSGEKLEKRIGGLCKFIENQAESLRDLGVLLSLALDDKLVNHLGKAIEKLNHLKNLELKFHRSLKSVKEVMIPSLEQTLYDWDSSSEKKFVIPKKWNPNFAKHLYKLSNLENFRLDFGILNPSGENAAEWFIDIMRTLPSLKKLRKIKMIAYEGGALKSEEKKIFNALRELENIREIRIELYDNNGHFTSTFQNFRDLRYEIYEKQAVRHDLMF